MHRYNIPRIYFNFPNFHSKQLKFSKSINEDKATEGKVKAFLTFIIEQHSTQILTMKEFPEAPLVDVLQCMEESSDFFKRFLNIAQLEVNLISHECDEARENLNLFSMPSMIFSNSNIAQIPIVSVVPGLTVETKFLVMCDGYTSEQMLNFNKKVLKNLNQYNLKVLPEQLSRKIPSKNFYEQHLFELFDEKTKSFAVSETGRISIVRGDDTSSVLPIDSSKIYLTVA